MITIDTHTESALALVSDDDGRHLRYVPLSDAPPMTDDSMPTGFPQTYLGQMHYVASHIAVGLHVHARRGEDGTRPPKDGWTRYRPKWVDSVLRRG